MNKKMIRYLCILTCITLILSLFSTNILLFKAKNNDSGDIKKQAVRWLIDTYSNSEACKKDKTINDTYKTAKLLKDIEAGEDNEWLHSIEGYEENEWLSIIENSKDRKWLNEAELKRDYAANDILSKLYQLTDNQDYLKTITASQNADGGFGINNWYESDILDTIIVFEALIYEYQNSSENEAAKEILDKTVSYLIKNMNADGGFPYISKQKSDFMLTVKAGLLLNLYISDEIEENADLTECIQKIDAFIQSHNYDMEQEEYFEEAAYACIYAYERKLMYADNTYLPDTLSKLQQTDGSFNESIADTVAAVRLMNAYEKYNAPYLVIDSINAELSSYVLYKGFENTVTASIGIGYITNCEINTLLRIECIQETENGKTSIYSFEAPVVLSSEGTHIQNDIEMQLICESEAVCTLEIKLYNKESEVVLAQKTVQLNVAAPYIDELIIAGIGSEDGVNLYWNDISNEFYRFGYRVYRKMDNGEWETRSSWDGEEIVKVLNIYPCTQAKDHLTNWLTKELEGEAAPAGRGLFKIDTVLIDNYNIEPAKYLFDENGNYKYDVLYFGAYDSNASKDLSRISYEATQSFINMGGGVLFGHDTLCLNTYHPYFTKFAEQLGTKILANGSWTISSKVKIVNEVFLTSYPWKVQGTLEISLTHNTLQFTGGTLPATVWMQFEGSSAYDSATDSYANAYLFTRNQLAMIQTGHSNGQATDDEKKVLANTLFYLKQFTTKTYMQDKSAYDLKAPSVCEVTDILNMGDFVSFNALAEDFGTQYTYYVEALPQKNYENVDSKQSEKVNITSISGVKYYFAYIDENSEAGSRYTQENVGSIPDGGTAQGSESRFMQMDENGNFLYLAAADENGLISIECDLTDASKTYYLHIAAADAQMNVGEETVYEIPAYQKTCSSGITTDYSMYASEGITVYCSSFTADKNIYSGGDFTTAGSAITVKGSLNAAGSINAYVGLADIFEENGHTGYEEMPNLHNNIVQCMSEAGEIEEIKAYNSTSIDTPTHCLTTTGAYCPEITLSKSLMSESTINVGAAEFICGTDEAAALYSVNGDININVSSFSGNGIIYAPNGTVTINAGEVNFTGSIIAEKIVITGSFIDINAE